MWSSDQARPLPFGARLPESSEQVLHPERYLGKPDRPTEVRFVADPPEGWSEVHADGLGELEVRILLEEHIDDPDVAAAAAEGWDGDRYRLLRGEAGEVLVWGTVWDSGAEAAEFELAVTRAFEARYGNGSERLVTVQAATVDDRPVVTVVDSPIDLAVDVLEGAEAIEVSGD